MRANSLRDGSNPLRGRTLSELTLSNRKRVSLALLIVALLTVNGAVLVGRALAPAEANPAAGVALARATPTTTTPPPPPTTTTTPNVSIPRLSHPIHPAGPPGGERVVQIGMITIPKIGLNHPIFEGVTLKVIDHGPSHWPGTALPGEVGNTVFAGHRVTHSHPFRNIDQLVPGDEVFFDINGKHSVYSVTGHEIVKPTDVWVANQTPDATGTLFACHPPGSKTFRYVVRLKLVS